MSGKEILEKGEQVRRCLKRAVHEELVKKAKLGQSVIINRGGKPHKISAAEALYVQEESKGYGSKS